jgi:F-type H+-transporting ATPase subunit gamma
MAATKEIKRRIKSVKNTKKITNAMELMAASKMRRAVTATVASRAYARYSWEVLESISNALTEESHPLLTPREGNRSLVVLITSTRGLCGGYDAQIIRQVMIMLRAKKPDEQIDFITVGKKGDAAMRRIGQNIIATFQLPDTIKLADTVPISKIVTDAFTDNSYDRIYVVYTDFKSALSQIPQVRQLLPVQVAEVKNEIEKLKEDAPKTNQPVSYTFEPSYAELIESLVAKIARMQVYQMLLESSASEQSARMVAMKNASEAAGEMIDDLTLAFNKARQASITQEISEISAGMASLS